MDQCQTSLSVGVQSFDQAHMQMFLCFNEFHAAIQAGTAPEKIAAILEKLRSCTLDHFENEEKWLARKNDPNLTEHIAHHRQFQSQIDHLIRDYNSQKIILSEAVSKSLREWMTGHIMTIDRCYAMRYRQQGFAHAD